MSSQNYILNLTQVQIKKQPKRNHLFEITFLISALIASNGFCDAVKYNNSAPLIAEENNDIQLIGWRQSISYERNILERINFEIEASHTDCETFSTDAQDIKWESYGTNVSLSYNMFSKWIFDLKTKGGIGYRYITGNKDAFSGMEENMTDLPYEKINDNKIYALAEIGVRASLFNKRIFLDLNPISISLGYRYSSIYPNIGVGVSFQ